MPHLQVKNISEDLHRELREAAAELGCRMRDIVLAGLQGELRRLAFERRLARREPVDLGRPAADFVAMARAERGE